MEGEPEGWTVRPVAADDVPGLVDLQRAYYAEDGYPFDASRARAAWETLISDPSLGRAWAFDRQTELLGYVALTLGFSLEHRGRDAFVDELYVVRSWRRRGVGRRALAVVDDACRELGVEALHLEVERDKPHAVALYRRLGFHDSGRLLMTRGLTDRVPRSPLGPTAA